MYFEDDQTSSNSPGPPAGGGSSNRGYRNPITDAVVSSIGSFRRGNGNSHGPGRNDRERRNNNQRRNHNERQNNNRERDTLGDYLRHIAHTTLEILDDGEYFPPGQDGPYDLTVKILWTNENTRYYGPGAGVGGVILESEFIAAASRIHDDDNANSKYRTRVQATVPPNPPNRATLDNTQTKIYIGDYSTLFGARKIHFALARNPDPFIDKKIGVLNFASAKKPGGEFINGARSQVRISLSVIYMIIT